MADDAERKVERVQAILDRAMLARAKETEAAQYALTMKIMKRTASWALGVIVFAGTLLTVLKPSHIDQSMTDPGVALTVAIGLLLGIGTFAIPWFITQRAYMKNQNKTFDQRMADERELHAKAMEKLRLASELTTLMELNQDQIKTYHDIVTEQADKSFKSSRIAMGVGMVLLVAAAVGGAWVPLEQVRWFIGALAAFSTLLSGYLSKTYLTLYKEAIGQLNRYFDQPVLNSYYLAAERLVGKLGEEHQDEIRKQVIWEILENSARMSGRLGSQKQQAGKPRPKKRVPKKQTASLNGTPQA